MPRLTSVVVLSLMLSAFHCTSFGQVKTERERDIKAREVPSQAKEWMNDSYEGVRRIHWVEESSDQGVSFEAKLKHQKQWHSVEFNIEGVIQDIEVELDQNAIDEELLIRIESSLAQAFDRYRILKIQRQWTGSPDELEDAIDEGEVDEVTTRYEIELEGVKEGVSELREVLLDHKGKLLSSRPISSGIHTNLNY
jgi:hypothetical protein